MESGIYKLNNYSSVLEAKYYPPLDISDGNYEMGVLKFKSNFKIPNVSKELKNNTLTIIKNGKFVTFIIEDGTYSVNHIKDILEEKIGDGFVITPNTNTFKCEIESPYSIFIDDTSILILLGFNKQTTEANKKYISDNEVDIFKVKSINIHCPLAIGQYVNSKHTDIIYDFYIKVNPGYDIIEEPKNLDYYPLTGRNFIDHIRLELRDQYGELIDFRGEYIEVQLKIQKIK